MQQLVASVARVSEEPVVVCREMTLTKPFLTPDSFSISRMWLVISHTEIPVALSTFVPKKHIHF